MIRTTNATVSRNIIARLSNDYSRLTTYQEELSTGKRLMHPSDDPMDVGNDIKLRSKMSQLDQYNKNINDGLGYMKVSDTAMSSMNNIMQRVRELTIQAANDTLSATQRVDIGKEVNELVKQMTSLGNTTFKGDYVFGGTHTKNPPMPLDSSVASSPQDYADKKMAVFNAGAANPAQINDGFSGKPITSIIPGTVKFSYGAGAAQINYIEGTDFSVDYVTGKITILPTSTHLGAGPGGLNVDISTPANYQAGQYNLTFDYVGHSQDIYGNDIVPSGAISRQIEEATNSQINVTSTDMFVDPTTGTNLISSRIQLGQNLQYNNRAGLNGDITNIDTGMKVLLSAQSTNGSRENRFNETLTRNESQTTDTTALRSSLEDADIAETTMNFTLAQNVYNLALQSAAKVIQPSLASFL